MVFGGTGFVEQSLAHAPQLPVLVIVSTHEFPHLVPVVHWQTPAAQYCPPGQTCPQAPQLFESVPITLMHCCSVAQYVVPLAHPHTPLEQLSPVGQTCPHVAQFWLSLSSLIEHGLVGAPPHCE